MPIAYNSAGMLKAYNNMACNETHVNGNRLKFIKLSWTSKLLCFIKWNIYSCENE